jgi:uncharacterized protein YndB with AHSA1/START domain
MSKPVYVYDTFIRAPAERIWQALTTAEFTTQYFHQTQVESDWETGSRVLYRMADGTGAVEGEVLESDPPRKLVITWRPLYSPELAEEPPSRVRFEIESMGEVCRLSIRHDQFEIGSQVYEQISGGWSAIISSLKSLLETGKALEVAGNETTEPEPA